MWVPRGRDLQIGGAMRPKIVPISSVVAVLVTLVFGLVIFGCGRAESTSTSDSTVPQTSGEVEATEFQGVKLTPISEQGNNALRSTQVIDGDAYRLTVDGLVEQPLSLSYADLQAYDQESWLMDLNCVEGWSFTAKWTGPSLSAILDDVGVEPEAVIAIFYTSDVDTGYTSLDLGYIRDNDILLALKLNDITLTPERGFPLQVVAKDKYGYKWAKWVTRIELSADADFRGFWESGGYNNNADDDGPAFE
jgi:DMSO/TMAO reductase YedYZ molybdopterin-dependent catalytic subunit